MATYFVETYRPAYPATGVSVHVHTERGYSADVLNPGVTSVWRVDHVRSKVEALAVCIERAAGKPVTASQVL